MHTWVLFLAIGLVGATPAIKGWTPRCFAYQRDLNILYLRTMSGSRSIPGSPIRCDPEVPLSSDYGMYAIEAVRYEVERINERQDILPNVSLGFIAVDTCGQDLVSLAATIYSMPNKADSQVFPDDTLITCGTDSKRFTNVVAAVGPTYSTAGVMVGALSSLFEFPVVMTWTSSDELSDKTRFAYTMRLVPPDSFASDAMTDLMLEFGWNYAALLYMEGSYGENGGKQITKRAKKKGICIAVSYMFPSDYDDNDVREIATKLLKLANLKVIVAFMGSSQLERIINMLQALGKEEPYLWIGSDAFNVKIGGKLSDGSIGIRYDTFHDKEFRDYFEGINPVNTPDNPWVPLFWEKQLNCVWNESHGENSCEALKEKPHGYEISETSGEGKPMDGVQVVARALHALITEKCPSAFGDRNQIRQCVKGRDLHAFMLKSSFDGNSGRVQFNEKGDFLGRYLFRQYQHATGEVVDIASWNKIDQSLQLRPHLMHWFSHKANGSEKGEIPEAVCSEPCKPKEYYLQKELPCCWECRECRNNEIIAANHTTCEVCPALFWPDEETVSFCVKIEPDFLSWSSPLTISLLTITAVGSASCIIVATIFTKNKNEKLIKASSRQLMGIILVGIFMAYGTVVIFLIHPSTLMCYLGRFGFNMSVSFIYAPLMIKTSRVYRIFTAGRKGTIRPPLTGTKAQILMVLAAIFSQIALCVVSTILAEPVPIFRMQIPTEKYVEVLCNLPLSGLLPPLCLNLLFILTCAAFGFLTRKLPENFNESWYIFVSVATTTFLWLVFLPAYFTAFYAVHQIALLISCLIINATITLLCLYFPKIYCIYFLDESDIQFQTAGTIGTTHVAPNAG